MIRKLFATFALVALVSVSSMAQDKPAGFVDVYSVNSAGSHTGGMSLSLNWKNIHVWAQGEPNATAPFYQFYAGPVGSAKLGDTVTLEASIGAGLQNAPNKLRLGGYASLFKKGQVLFGKDLFVIYIIEKNGSNKALPWMHTESALYIFPNKKWLDRLSVGHWVRRWNGVGGQVQYDFGKKSTAHVALTNNTVFFGISRKL